MRFKILWITVIIIGLITLLIVSPFQVTFATNSISANGDFVLSGNKVFEVKDEEFKVSGNVILKDNASLIVTNGTLSIIQSEALQYNYQLMNQARLILQKGSHLQIYIQGEKVDQGRYQDRKPISLNDESMLEVIDSFVHIGISCGDHSSIDLRNSRILSLGAYGQTSVQINSTVVHPAFTPSGEISEDGGNVNIGDSVYARMRNSSMRELVVSGKADVQVENLIVKSVSAGTELLDSEVTLWIFDSPSGEEPGLGLWHSSTIWLVNSPLTESGISFWSPKSLLIFGWYLDVHFNSDNQPVEGAEVEVYYAHNGSIATKGTTDSDGNARFILPEKTLRKYEGEIIGNYNVKASFNDVYGEEKVTLDSSKQITVNLQSIPPNTSQPVLPFYATPLGLATVFLVCFLAGIALAVVAVFFRRRTRRTQHI